MDEKRPAEGTCQSYSMDKSKQLRRLLDAVVRYSRLTDSELETLSWLACCSSQTVDDLVSIFDKLRAC